MDKVFGFFLVACAFAALSSAISIAWWHTRQRALRAEQLIDRLLAERSTPQPQKGAHSIDVLEIIANEVERLGEGQRFLTNTLLERPRVEEPIQHNFPRSITPHWFRRFRPGQLV